MARDPNRCPTHPGEIIREDVIPALGMKKLDFANRLGISRQHLYDITREKKPVTPPVAVRLGKFLGNSPLLWLNMQSAHDAWHAERETDVSNIKPLELA